MLLEGLVAGGGEDLLLEHGEVDRVGVLEQALVAVAGADADCFTPPEGEPLEAYAVARMSLTLTLPASMRAATAVAFLRSPPHTLAFRP